MKKGWVEAKLGDVCTLQRGFDLPKGSRTAGDFPLVSSSGIIDTHDIFKVKAPGVATGRSGSIGNVFYIENDYWPLNTVLYVKDFHGNDARFVYYLLTQFNLGKFSSGVGVPTLNRNFVHDELVSIPTSVPEQQRIVSVLDEAFASIAQAKANAERNLVNARELFESALAGMYDSAGAHWEERNLGDIASEMQTGPFGSTLHKSDYVANGIPVVNPQNIVDGKIVPLQKMMVSQKTKERLSRYILQEKDIVLARRGEMGRCAIVEKEQVGWLCGSGSFVVRIKKEVNANYLVRYLSSAKVKRILQKGSVGTTMDNLNQGILSQVPVPFPPLAEQRAIVGRLEALSAETKRLEGIYQSKLEALEELKKSVLQRAFEGEL